MNLRYLKCFVVVAEHLHFTRAAEQLGIAQPALSQQIRKLEQDLGVELFFRTNRSVNLSEYGRALLPRARQLLAQANIARNEIEEMAGLTRGHLRVGASGTIATFLLPEILAEYRKRYPNIIIEITQRRSEAVLELVEVGKLDLGLIRLPFRSTVLEIAPVFTEPLYAALPPGHPAATAAKVYLHQLKEDAFIMPVSEHEPFYSVITNLCAEEDFTPNIIAAGAEYTTVFRLVGMGMGISIVSELATNLKVTPSPAFVHINHPKASSLIVAVANPRASLSPAAQAIQDLLQAWKR